MNIQLLGGNVPMNTQVMPHLRSIRAELINNVAGDDWAKRMKGKHLEPGVVKYDNDDGTSKVYLLPREAIAKMRPTAEGKPIVGSAGDFDHMNVNAKGLQEGEYDGVVVQSYDGDGDGWEWIEFMVTDPETRERCKKGYQLSCAYIPTETDGKPGKWHNIDYDETILNGEYTHFAVVPNPRYEGAVIQLVNSLKRGGDIVEKMLKTLLCCVPLPQLKALVNSIEEDEKKKADDLTKKNAEEEAKKVAAMTPEQKAHWLAIKGDQEAERDLAKQKKANAAPPAKPANGECELCGRKATKLEFRKGVGGQPSNEMWVCADLDGCDAKDNSKKNAAPPDPAVEGPAVVTKDKQPETGTEEAAKNDGNEPPTKPEPGQPGSPEGPKPASEASPVPKNDGDAPQTRPEPEAGVKTAANKTDEEKAAKDAAKEAEKTNAMDVGELREYIAEHFWKEVAEGKIGAECQALIEKGGKMLGNPQEFMRGVRSDARAVQSAGGPDKPGIMGNIRNAIKRAIKNMAGADEPKPELKEEKPNASDADLEAMWSSMEMDDIEAIMPNVASRVAEKDGKLLPLKAQTSSVQAAFKESYEDAHENMLNSLKAMRERQNTLRQMREKRNSIGRQALQRRGDQRRPQTVDLEKQRQERFNSLRIAAEERGGFVGTAGNQVVSPDDKQDLGRARYGSQA